MEPKQKLDLKLVGDAAGEMIRLLHPIFVSAFAIQFLLALLRELNSSDELLMLRLIAGPPDHER